MPIGYKFDRLKGSTVAATSKSAYNPQSFKAADSIPIQRASKSEQPVKTRSMSSLKIPLKAQVPIAQAEVHGKFPDTESYRKLQEKQRIMMRQDGKFVWQKLPHDRVFYKFTVALTACTLGYMLFSAKNLVFPPKKE